MYNSDLNNGNVFLISGGCSKPPKIYSSFQRAEEHLLNRIRALGTCGFVGFTITCVQINTNAIRETVYGGDIRIEKGFKYITIKRDEKNSSGCKKSHREKIRINLDY